MQRLLRSRLAAPFFWYSPFSLYIPEENRDDKIATSPANWAASSRNSAFR
jgi:hypothetical protein